MIKKMFFVMSIMNISLVLYGMQTPRKKKEELKSKKSLSKKQSQDLASSSEDNDQSNQTYSEKTVSSSNKPVTSKGGKVSVRSLDDLVKVRDTQSNLREKMYSSSDSVSVLGKK